MCSNLPLFCPLFFCDSVKYIPSSLYTLSTILYNSLSYFFYIAHQGSRAAAREKIGIFPGIFWPFQLVSFILRPGLRILAEKVRWVWFWRWEFSVKLKPCYVVLIPTLRRTLRLFFLGMVKTAFYSPGSRKTREHSIRSNNFTDQQLVYDFLSG